MKYVRSLKNALKRAPDAYVAFRKKGGVKRLYVISKSKPKIKCRQ